MASNDEFRPWLRYSELTEERLGILATIVREVRDEVARLHDPEAGDRAWSRACRVYDRTCFAIEKASKSYSWLTILPDHEKPLRFTFAIGHVPLRFYTGEPDDPPSRYLASSYAEIHQIQQALDFGLPIPKDGILRLAVETNSEGRVTHVSIVEMNAARKVTDTYEIPFEVKRGPIPMRPRPIDTPAPEVKRKEDENEEREERDASGQ